MISWISISPKVDHPDIKPSVRHQVSQTSVPSSQNYIWGCRFISMKIQNWSSTTIRGRYPGNFFSFCILSKLLFACGIQEYIHLWLSHGVSLQGNHHPLSDLWCWKLQLFFIDNISFYLVLSAFSVFLGKNKFKFDILS